MKYIFSFLYFLFNLKTKKSFLEIEFPKGLLSSLTSTFLEGRVGLIWNDNWVRISIPCPFGFFVTCRRDLLMTKLDSNDTSPDIDAKSGSHTRPRPVGPLWHFLKDKKKNGNYSQLEKLYYFFQSKNNVEGRSLFWKIWWWLFVGCFWDSLIWQSRDNQKDVAAHLLWGWQD